MNVFVSSSEAANEEEATHPIGRNKAKMIVRKGKDNEDSYSQSEHSNSMVAIMFTLKMLDTSFSRAQM
jgi:hypothetical protein